MAVLEYALNFEYFEIKHEPHNFSISEIIDSQRCGYLNA